LKVKVIGSIIKMNIEVVSCKKFMRSCSRVVYSLSVQWKWRKV